MLVLVADGPINRILFDREANLTSPFVTVTAALAVSHADGRITHAHTHTRARTHARSAIYYGFGHITSLSHPHN